MNQLLGTAVVTCAVALLPSVSAFAINIDLSGAASGTLISAPGGSFAQSFVGQTVSGINLVGAPSNPLTLQAGGTLEVAFFNSFNTILPQPGNTAPLALLLGQAADSISWTMGSASGGSVTIDFYNSQGTVVNSVTQALLDNYNTYSYSGFGSFAGLAIYNDTDPAGLRYYDFQYNPAAVRNVPDAGSSAFLLTVAVGSLAAIRRKLQP